MKSTNIHHGSRTAAASFLIAKAVACLLSALLLGATSAHALKLKFGGILIPESTNTVEVKFEIAGAAISASLKPESTNSCSESIDMDTAKVSLLPGITYTLYVREVQPWYCGYIDANTLAPNTHAWFDFTNAMCYDFRIGDVQTNVFITPHSSYDGGIYVTYQNDYGEIAFEPCGPLIADGQSTKDAYLTKPEMFVKPISWSIKEDNLGCSIEGFDTWARITAGTNSGTITVQATDANGCGVEAGLDLDDGSSDRGCSTCGGDDGAAAGEGDVAIDSIHLEMFLGKTVAGASARSLLLTSGVPTNTMYTPAGLSYPWQADNVQVIRTNGTIRQIRAPQVLADVVVSNASRYDVKFYKKADVLVRDKYLYELASGATPLTTWTIENPELTTTNKLRVTKSPANQNPVVYEYAWLTNGWELNSANGLRIETMTTAWTTNSNPVRTETRQVRQGTNAPVSIRAKRYEHFPWGTRLIEEMAGTGSLAKTNSYTYYTNGFTQQVIRSDGSWEYYVYDSSHRPTTVFSSYLNEAPTTNGALCRVAEYDYSTNVVSGSGDTGEQKAFAPRRTITYLKGQEIGRSYNVYLPGEIRTIACLVPGADWNGSTNEVTISKFYTNAIYSGRIQSVLRPDGTMELHEYLPASNVNSTPGENKTNVVWIGKPGTYGTNVVEGTVTTTIVGSLGQMVSRTQKDILSALTFSSETYSDYDVFNRPQKITYLDNTYTYSLYSCCGEQVVTNREGTVTTHAYDALGRRISSTTAGITISNLWDAGGNLIGIVRKGTDGSAYAIETSTFDTVGRRLAKTNALNHGTTFSETLGPITRTTTHPNSTTRIETFARDGALLSITGTSVHGVRYTNGLLLDGGAYRFYSAEIKLNGTDTLETVTNYFDMLDRIYKVAYPGGATEYNHYSTNGRLVKRVDADGVTTLYGYNGAGVLEYTAIDMDGSGAIETNGTDRITRRIRSYGWRGSDQVRKDEVYVWATNGNSTALLIQSVESALLAPTTWSMRDGLPTTTEMWLDGQGGRLIYTLPPDGAETFRAYQDGRLVASTNYAEVLTFGYDPHGRNIAITNARTGTTTQSFDNADRRVSWTTPPPAAGQSGLTTTVDYDSMGSITNIVLPDAANVRTDYHPTREPATNWGVRTYPVAYTYDYAGRRKTMTTWKDFATRTGSAVTTWNYDACRGFLMNKAYADGKGTTYAYTNSGRLVKRIWARGVETTYAYNAAGDLSSVDYSDSTPDATYGFDRRGRQTSVTQGTNTTGYVLNDAGQLLSESHTAGTLIGISVTNKYDGLLRRTNNGVFNGTTWLTDVRYIYGTASWLVLVHDTTNRINYTYEPDSPNIESINYYYPFTTHRFTSRKTYDNLDRLTSVVHSNTVLGTISAFRYALNGANQRTAITNADNSRWTYTYDPLGQVTAGKKHWSDGSLVPGQQFEYAYDDIGNRKWAASGGNEWGSGLRYENYTVNDLNQYTQRTVPGSVDMIGAATNAATVTVNNTATYRKGEYFRADLPLTNSASPVYAAITNLAVLANGTNADIVTNITGSLFLPRTPEAFLHDLDGNLIQDGRWTNRWDAENRWIEAESISAVPTAAKKRLVFGYDDKSRRIRKTVYDWDASGSGWVISKDLKFVYDGWNLLAELNGTNNAVINSYMWGVDLSGTPQGAGGVGGLLAMKSAQAGVHFYGCEGNGNIDTLINATSGVVSAQYTYNPFGDTISASGPLVPLNPFRYSTKYEDNDSDFIYYGYRFYDITSGRWINRDPIGEGGGLNLCGFVLNNSIGIYDHVGLIGCNQCKRTLDDIKKKTYRDETIKRLTEYLDKQRCAFDFACFEGDDCEKQSPPIVGSADAFVTRQGAALNYGPDKGKCTVRLCASKVSNLDTSLRHELSHCVSFCAGYDNNSCEGELCHEVYAFGNDGRCNDSGKGDQYYSCIRKNAKASAEATGLCKGKNMDAILTEAFIDKCLSANPPQ